ncbi:hypothetical protein JCM17478_35450 [Thermopirellula anaerolimosa]
MAAAVQAAQAGAKVFLVAPQPYLGDDMTATLRLWLEPGEEPLTPLAKRVFDDPLRRDSLIHADRYDFQYSADQPADPKHADTDPPQRLCDGLCSDAPSQSVQYNGDVTILAELDAAREIHGIRVIAFGRVSSDPASAFKVAGFTYSLEKEDGTWTPPVWAEPTPTTVIGNDMPYVIDAKLDGSKARRIKLHIKKADDCERILLGEIEIIGPPRQEDVDRLHAAFPAPRPMHVKEVLDDALLEAGVSFLYGSYPTDVIRDADGKIAGVVIANRAGRQAVIAKTVIDATDRAVVARLAGASFTPYPGGIHRFQKVVIGGAVVEAPNVSSRVIDPPFVGPFPNRAKTSSGVFPVIEYTFELPMEDDGWASWAKADQTARSLVYHPEQQFVSDVLFEVPPDSVQGEATGSGSWDGADTIPLGCFRAKGESGLWILGGCASVSRKQAAAMLRPCNLMAIGERLGREAAREAAEREAIRSPQVAAAETGNETRYDIGEFLSGVRPFLKWPTVPQEESGVSILGRYDVVVVGGGTGGAAAGIGAARQGAKTLVIEYLATLGGVGTAGAISSYYWGNRVGFTAEVNQGAAAWVIEQKSEWWRSELLKAGADIWMNCLGSGAVVDSGRVRGVVVVTPFGRGVVLADVVIDSTGNADIAAAAGAETMYTDDTEPAVQGTGLPPRNLGASYTNTDFTITDDTDVLDIWHVFVYAKKKYRDAFDQGRLIDSRERRRIVGEYTMTILDQMLERTYSDTICIAYSNFDTHGFTVDPYLELEHPEKRGFYVRIPYRCLIPKGLEGILVTGLGISAHRDAIPLIRMQADIQNQGFAAGTAAAWLAQRDLDVRRLDVRELQRFLVKVGNLPESVLSEDEMPPVPENRVREAVENLKTDYRDAAVILACPEIARPLLRKAYQEADQPEHRLIYAHALAVLGDNTGLETLIAAVKGYDSWDQGWNYVGMGQFGSALSRLDQLIVALGRTRDRRAVPVIVDKLRLLTPDSEFSHHRAIALALEMIGDPQAAQPLAELLTTPGMTGYVHRTVQDAIRFDQSSPGGTNQVKARRDSIVELSLARALFRCGDYGGIGEQILRAYTHDLRGHLARHAAAVLAAAGKAVEQGEP